ncbi:DUF2029 domain-containing protein [Rhizobium sp. ARZ01]|uniref:glycosyltransferase family 87 protein n=1 Tax=Rhizobium sp. ARZ01 TaxID=2769313 RepID=UPI00177CB438|nr:glycosyltransferase family 87 protein [Rhizobium sp. ARZ01]MBD9371452.1 DUF2029 domain-containing protein [Rhizobium sp. ARZ01]
MANQAAPAQTQGISATAAVAIAASLFAAIAWSILAVTDTDRSAITLGWSNKDFANYWIAARLTLQGAVGEVFSAHEVYFAHMQAMFGPDYPWHAWSYPPHYLWTILPVGLLDYKSALIAYLLATFLLFCASIRTAAPYATPRQWLFLLPAVATNAIATQNGFLTSALVLIGLASRYNRPILAGLCIGLLTVKPQLGLLLPLLLLYERRWLVIMVASLTALGLAMASVAAFGLSTWRGYIEHVAPYMTDVMRYGTGIFLHMMPSVYGSARSLELSSDVATAVHFPVALISLCLWFLSLKRLQSDWARAASTIFATFVISPYSLSYDLIALASVAALWPLPGANPPGKALRASLFAVAIMPILMPVLGLSGWPIASLLIPLAWLLLMRSEAASSPSLRHRQPSAL